MVMTRDAPHDTYRACVDFLQALGAPPSRRLVGFLARHINEMVERYSFMVDSEKPAGMSTSACWLQHIPDNSFAMQEVLKSKARSAKAREKRGNARRAERSRSR